MGQNFPFNIMHPSFLQLILSHTKNINAKDNLGDRTPLYMATKKSKNLEAVRLLLQHRASLNDVVNGLMIRDIIQKQFR